MSANSSTFLDSSNSATSSLSFATVTDSISASEATRHWQDRPCLRISSGILSRTSLLYVLATLQTPFA